MKDMKKMLILIGIFLFNIFSFNSVLAWGCDYDPAVNSGPLTEELSKCLNDSKLVNSDWKITGWFKTSISRWVDNISLFLWIGAVLWIVYVSFTLTISAWDDEKVNKAKDIIKWSIIGFIWLITASLIINVLVRVIYSIS